MVDEVDRAPAPRGDDGQPGGCRLLEGLAEGLAGPGVHEHVEERVRVGEGLARALAEEDGRAVGPAGRRRDGLGQPGGGARAARPVADDDEPGAGHPGHLLEPLELLLGGEPPDVPDEHLAVGGELGTGTARRALRRPGWKRTESTPRPHRAVSVTPCSASSARVWVEGARVSGARACTRRIQRHAASAARGPTSDGAWRAR